MGDSQTKHLVHACTDTAAVKVGHFFRVSGRRLTDFHCLCPVRFVFRLKEKITTNDTIFGLCPLRAFNYVHHCGQQGRMTELSFNVLVEGSSQINRYEYFCLWYNGTRVMQKNSGNFSVYERLSWPVGLCVGMCGGMSFCFVVW